MKTVLLIFLLVGLGSLTSFGQIDTAAAKIGDSIYLDESEIALDSIIIDYHQEATIARCYPTFVKDKLYIDFGWDPCRDIEGTVKIYSSFTGQLVFEQPFKNQLTIETTSWPKGMYIVWLDHTRGTQRIKVFR